VKLFRALERYGDPRSLAEYANAELGLRRRSGAFQAPDKAERLSAEAESSVGVRVGDWQRRRIPDHARQALMDRHAAAAYCKAMGLNLKERS
jgi:hypothetical protein